MKQYAHALYIALQLLPLALTVLEDLRSTTETAQRTLFTVFQV
jgi:hypothetical protein